MIKVALNARFYAHRPTGMQRYAMKVSALLRERLVTLMPDQPLTGIKGHLWEQTCLPAALKGLLLWSPNTTGPLCVPRQVCTIHDLAPLDHPEWFSGRFAKWYKWLLPPLARRVEHLIVISQYTKSRIVDCLGVEPERITVIPNGIDAQFQVADAAAIAGMRNELGISRPYLLYVGSLEPRKNLGRLLEAWGAVEDSVPNDIELIVAGAPGRTLVFSRLEVEHVPTRVHFVDYVPEQHLAPLYSGAIAMIYPSLYEGFGLPPLEAMACGAPVITSKTTSLPEVTGDAAILINPAQVNEIADAIVQVVECAGLRAEMRSRGREQARQFSWDRAAASTWDVLGRFAACS
jgi:glycosyltransferase involved in cell wall biosynthesis